MFFQRDSEALAVGMITIAKYNIDNGGIKFGYIKQITMSIHFLLKILTEYMPMVNYMTL